MDLQLVWGLLLTILPITELRAGLPVVVDYCLKNNLNVLPFFLLVILLNCVVIFLIYLFLEFLHVHLIKWGFYQRIFNKVIAKIRRKNQTFEKKFNELGYLALALFVAVPLPGTGAWTGTFLAWFTGLDKKKSVIAISLGVFIAGIIILFFSLGLFRIIY